MLTVEIHNVLIQYSLVCPKCEWVHWLTEMQYNDSSYHLTCDCGARFKPIRIPKKIKERVEKHIYAQAIRDLAKILVETGMSNKEAKDKAQKVFNKDKNAQTLIREALSLG